MIYTTNQGAQHMAAKRETNLLIKEAQAKLTLTDDAIEMAVSQREGFFNPIQSVQVKSTRFTLEKVVELIENGNQILPEKCKHNSSTGVYIISYLPPENVIKELKSAFLTEYRNQLKVKQSTELAAIVDELTAEYKIKLEQQAEQDKQYKLDKAKADLLKILSGEVIAQ